MFSFKVNSFLFASIMFCIFGCTEIVRNTRDIGIEVSNREITANNEDFAIIKVDFGVPLVKEQDVLLTTTDGVLYTFPIQNWGSADNSLVVNPTSDTLTVVLRAGNEIRSNVIFSLSLNNVRHFEQLEFTRSCPMDIILSLKETKITLPNDTLNIQYYLESKTGIVSKRNKFKASLYAAENDSLLSVLLPIFLDTTFNHISLKTNLPTQGTYYVKVESDIESCDLDFEQNLNFEVIR